MTLAQRLAFGATCRIARKWVMDYKYHTHEVILAKMLLRRRVLKRYEIIMLLNLIKDFPLLLSQFSLRVKTCFENYITETRVSFDVNTEKRAAKTFQRTLKWAIRSECGDIIKILWNEDWVNTSIVKCVHTAERIRLVESLVGPKWYSDMIFACMEEALRYKQQAAVDYFLAICSNNSSACLTHDCLYIAAKSGRMDLIPILEKYVPQTQIEVAYQNIFYVGIMKNDLEMMNVAAVRCSQISNISALYYAAAGNNSYFVSYYLNLLLPMTSGHWINTIKNAISANHANMVRYLVDRVFTETPPSITVEDIYQLYLLDDVELIEYLQLKTGREPTVHDCLSLCCTGPKVLELIKEWLRNILENDPSIQIRWSRFVDRIVYETFTKDTFIMFRSIESMIPIEAKEKAMRIAFHAAVAMGDKDLYFYTMSRLQNIKATKRARMQEFYALEEE